MRLSVAWTIARKDFSVFWRKKGILFSLAAFPLGIAVGLPAVLALVVRRGQSTYAQLLPLTDAFAFFFIISSSIIGVALGSYTIVGEKTERTLESLLMTPATDGELLAGKVLAAFLPTIGSTLFGGVVFQAMFDGISHAQLGYYFYPNWTMAVFLGIAAPLACLLSVELNVLFSAHATDVREAQQLGGLLAIPFAALYVLGEIRVLTLDEPTLLVISGVLALFCLLLVPLSRATFQREQILTRWK